MSTTTAPTYYLLLTADKTHILSRHRTLLGAHRGLMRATGYQNGPVIMRADYTDLTREEDEQLEALITGA